MKNELTLLMNMADNEEEEEEMCCFVRNNIVKMN